MFGNFTIKQKVSDKYLGQVLHSGGVEASATATVQERSGRIKGAAMEIRSIVEEYQLRHLEASQLRGSSGKRHYCPVYLVGQGHG